MSYRSKPKSEQTRHKSKPKRPKKALIVEPNLALFLTDKPYKSDQLHVNKKRTIKNIHDFFYTCEYLYESKKLDQTWKDEAFPERKISDFLKLFSYWDSQQLEIEEQNKQNINFNAITQGLSYLEQRYSEFGLISRQAKEFRELIDVMRIVSATKFEDSKGTEFYKLRGKAHLPPEIKQYDNQFVVMCKICWEHRITDSNTNLKTTITKIRHKPHCLYDKKQIERCIEIIPPKELFDFSQLKIKKTK